MMQRVLSLLNDQMNMTVNSKIYHIPSHYAEILQLAVQKELSEEVSKLYTLYQQSFNNLDQFKDGFLKLCIAREIQNQCTYLSYFSLIEGVCNRLYFDVAILLFKPANFYELLRILLPGITTRIGLNISDTLNNKEQYPKLEDRLNIIFTPQALQSLSVYPPQLSIFTESIYDAEHKSIFMLDDIKHYPLYIHQKIYQNLETYPHLKENIYKHNDDYKQLIFDIVLIENKACKPDEMLKRFANALIYAGEKYTGRKFADNSAVIACQQFQTYLDQLPHELKNKLLALKGNEKPHTLKYIIEMHLGKGDCIEQAAAYINSIRANSNNHAILHEIPHSSLLQLQLIKNKYQRPLNIIGYENVKTLPIRFTKDLLKNIRINSLNSYIDLLINIPAEEYQTLLLYADIQCYPALPADLGVVIAMFNTEQQQAFYTAIINQKNKLNVNCVLYFAVKNKLSFMVEEVLKTIPVNLHYLHLMKTDANRQALLDIAIFNKDDKTFNAMWRLLSKHQHLILSQKNDGISLIHYIAKYGSALILKEVLDGLSDQEQIDFLNERSAYRDDLPLEMAADKNNSDTFNFIWSHMQVKKMTMQKNRLNMMLQSAIRNCQPQMFYKLWECFSKEEKIRILIEKDSDGVNVIFKVLSYADLETWKIVLNCYQENEQSKLELDNILIVFPLICRAIKLKSLPHFALIWENFSEDQKIRFLTYKNQRNESIVNTCIVANSVSILNFVWDKLSRDKKFALIEYSFFYTFAAVNSVSILDFLWNKLCKDEKWMIVEKQFKLAANANADPMMLNYILKYFSAHDVLAITKNIVDTNKFTYGGFFANLMLDCAKQNEFQLFIEKIIQAFFLEKNEILSIRSFIISIVRYAKFDMFNLAWHRLSVEDKNYFLREQRLKIQVNNDYIKTECSNLLYYALMNSDAEIWNTLWKFYDEKVKLNLLKDYNLLHLALHKNRKNIFTQIFLFLHTHQLLNDYFVSLDLAAMPLAFFAFVWQFIPPQQQGELLQSNPEILYRIIKEDDTGDIFKSIWESLSASSRMLAINKVYDGRTLLHWAIESNNDIFYYLWNGLNGLAQLALLQKYDEVPSILYWVIIKLHNNIDIFKLLWKKISHESRVALLSEQDVTENTVFHYTAKLHNPRLFCTLWNWAPHEMKFSIIQKINNAGNTVLHYAVYNSKILQVILDTLPTQAIRPVLSWENKRGTTPLMLALNTYPSFELLWQIISDPEKKFLLKTENKGGMTLLQYAAQSSDPDSWLSIWNSYTVNEKREVLENDNEMLLFYAFEKNDFVFRSLLTFIKENKLDLDFILNFKNSKNSTLIELAISSVMSIQYFELIWNILPDKAKNRLIEFNTFEESYIFQTLKANHHAFNILWKYCIERDAIKRSLLVILIMHDKHHAIKDYMNHLSADARFSIMCGRVNNNDSLLQMAFKNNKSHAATTILSFFSLPELSAIIRINTLFNNNLLHLAIHTSNIILITSVLSHLSENEALAYMCERNDQGYTSFHFAAKNCNVYIWRMLMQYVPSNKYYEMITSKNFTNSTPLHFAAENNNPEIVGEMLNMIPEKLRLQVIMQKNHFGNAPLHRAAKNTNSAILSTMLSCLNDENRNIALNGSNFNNKSHAKLATPMSKSTIQLHF